MSDETPKSEGEPSPASPEETPTAETTPVTHDDAVPAAASDTPADAPVEAPVEAPAEAPTQATPTAAMAAAPAQAEPEHRAGIFIPKWVGLVAAAIIAALVFGGIGYAIGDSSGSGSTENASNTVPSNGNGNGGQQVPGGQLPNGRELPGNGSDGTTAANAGFLGVAAQSAENGNGVEITEVASDSPAAKAGLKTGDVITAIDGDDVTTAVALRSAVLAKESGDEITVAYTRDGASSTVKVTLSSRSAAQSS